METADSTEHYKTNGLGSIRELIEEIMSFHPMDDEDVKWFKDEIRKRFKDVVDHPERFKFKYVVDHINPEHYKAGGLEAIDVIEAFDLNFRLGNAIKYILRAGKKDDRVQDLKKAKWYLDRELEKSDE